jgi:hypothetical protein
MKNYLIQEKGYTRVFAMVANIDSEKLTESNIDLISKVGQSVEDFFNYENPVKLIEKSVSTDHNGTVMKFTGVDDFGDDEIREIILTEVVTY